MTRLQKAVSRILSHFEFFEIEADLVGETLSDDGVFSMFMGSGCSDTLTVGDIRELRKAFIEELDSDEKKE